MDISYYLKKYIPDRGRLAEYGFTEAGGALVCKKPLRQNGLYALVRITEKSMEVRVIDSAFDDDFIPFSAKESQCPEKHEVALLLDDIISRCFGPADVRGILIRHITERFGAAGDHPWEEYPDYTTFKTAASKKWFALFMTIKRRCIGLEGEGLVDVVNLKAAPERILALVDGEHYFNAYHMNKKHWLTALLDRDTDLDALKMLIEESYRLSEKHKA